MDWRTLMKLMMPIRLRHGRRLLALMRGLTGKTTEEAEEAERYKAEEIQKAQRLGQRMVVEAVLQERHGEGITITGQEDGNVAIFGHETPEEDYRKLCAGTAAGASAAVVITDVEHTDVGCDFVVHVPPGTDADAVRRSVEQMVLAGIGFRVEQQTE